MCLQLWIAWPCNPFPAAKDTQLLSSAVSPHKTVRFQSAGSSLREFLCFAGSLGRKTHLRVRSDGKRECSVSWCVVAETSGQLSSPYSQIVPRLTDSVQRCLYAHCTHNLHFRGNAGTSHCPPHSLMYMYTFAIVTHSPVSCDIRRFPSGDIIRVCPPPHS